MSHQKNSGRKGRPIQMTKNRKLKGGVVTVRMRKDLHLKLVKYCQDLNLKVNDLMLGLVYREIVLQLNPLDSKSLDESFSFRKSDAKTSTNKK